MAVAVTALVSVAVPLLLGRDSLAVAWALEVVALVWLAVRFRLDVLVLLARVLAVVAVFGTLLSGAEERTAGQLPVLNEFLYAYGVPALALAGAAWLAARRAASEAKEQPGVRRLAVELEWEAMLLGLGLVTLEIHQLFQVPKPLVPLATAAATTTKIGLAEWAAVMIGWLLYGWGLLRADRQAGRPSLERAGRFLLGGALLGLLLGPGLAVNPLWSHEPVGSRPLLNLLAFAFALPAILAVATTREVRRRGGRILPRMASVVALLLAFAWVTLQVRQIFHGSDLVGGTAGAAERYSYSAAWMVFGIVLLIAGIVRRGVVLRYGSLVVMLLAILKVFLWDTSNLSDLYRVLSFLGLGASLLLLGFLYQRFVFREVVE
jgi:uncharacterized membrane protein